MQVSAAYSFVISLEMIRGRSGLGGGVCVSVSDAVQEWGLHCERTMRKPHWVQTWKFQRRQVCERSVCA